MLIGHALLRNAAFLDIAAIRIQHWIARNGPRQPFLEWSILLKKDRTYVAKTLMAKSDEGNRLRTASPLMRFVTDSQQRLLFRAYAGPREARIPSAVQIVEYIECRLRGSRSPSALSRFWREQTDFLLLRFQHSTFAEVEILHWLRTPEPFLGGVQPIDLVRRGNALHVCYAIDAIDQGTYVLGGFIVP